MAASKPAGSMSELRKSSPTGHQGMVKVPSRSGRDSDMRGGSLNRAANNSMNMNDYRMPEYGQIKKVTPSRDGANDPSIPQTFSSKP